MMHYLKKRKGLSLIEILVALAILGLVLPVLTTFIWQSFTLNRHATARVENQQNARRLLDSMRNTVRNIGSGEGNQYPLEVCEAAEMVFYVDSDRNGQIDQVRYFVDGTQLMLGIIGPDEDNAYTGTEEVRILMKRLLNTADQPLFAYFDRNYDGSGAGLVSPVNCSEVTAVKIHVVLDAAHEPDSSPVDLMSVARFRNL